MIIVTVVIPTGVVSPMTQTIEAIQRGPTSEAEGVHAGGKRIYEWRFAGHSGLITHRRSDGPLALSAALLQAVDSEVPRFSCPVCWRTSWNPNDLEHGYCGACNDFTGR